MLAGQDCIDISHSGLFLNLKKLKAISNEMNLKSFLVKIKMFLASVNVMSLLYANVPNINGSADSMDTFISCIFWPYIHWILNTQFYDIFPFISVFI